MFEKLKRSPLGKRLYRLSRRGGIGTILRVLADFVQSEPFQFDHYHPRNIAHNRRQKKVLRRFVNELDR